MFDKKLVYRDGREFFQEELENYYIDYLPVEGADTICLTFENANPAIIYDYVERYAWSARGFGELGVTVIGFKPKAKDWYRQSDLHEFFRNEEFLNLVRAHKRIFLFGESMGGYAALTFARMFPGAQILAYTPQSTINPKLVPWEKRFDHALAYDWEGDFADAAEGLDVIDKAYIIYDPFFEPDTLQMKRLPQEKVVHLKVPFVEHVITVHLKKMGVLSDIPSKLVSGEMESWFPGAVRSRKRYRPYLSNANYYRARRAHEQMRAEQALVYLQAAVESNPKNEKAQAMLDILKEESGGAKHGGQAAIK